QENAKSAQGGLQQDISQAPQGEASPERKAKLLSLADAISLALEHSPLLQAAQQQVAGKTAQITQAKASFFPKLDVQESFAASNSPTFAFSSKLNQGQLTQQDFNLNRLNHPGEVNNFRTSVSFVQPLYTGGRASLGTEQARLQYQASVHSFDRQRQEVFF